MLSAPLVEKAPNQSIFTTLLRALALNKTMLSTLSVDEVPNQTIPVSNKTILLALQADEVLNERPLTMQLETPMLF